MANIKKINLFICSLLVLFASLFFVACGPKNYDNVTLTSSEDAVLMNIGDQRELSFTINNMVDDMDNSLNVAFSTEGIVTSEVVSSEGNVVNIRLTAVEAGSTTMTVTTLEGGKSCEVAVNVSKYSSYISAGTNSLFVSSSSPLVVSTSDFEFEDNTTERNLNYYFYGINNGATLSLDNVSSSNTSSDGTTTRVFYNQFVSVELINSDANGSQNSYLIFTDQNGVKYTLGPEQIDLSFGSSILNTKYEFVEVEIDSVGSYIIPSQASPVSIGDTFTFVAHYQMPDSESEIYTQREFVVLKDIEQNSILYNYGYVVLDEENNPLAVNTNEMMIADGEIRLGSSDFTGNDQYVFDREKITLVPEYVIDHPTTANYSVDYKRARLYVAVAEASDLINYSFRFDQANIFNVSSEVYSLSDGTSSTTLYVFEISTRSQVENEVNFVVNFYYDGFENSDNENVNRSFTIPVAIQNKPNNLLISGASFSNSTLESRSFVFYNNYQLDTIGWQRYYFSVMPNDSRYDRLTITLPAGCGVMVRYQGTTYQATEDQEAIAIITNLSNYVEFKGINGAEAVENAQIEIALNYNILGEDSITFDFNYSIKEGSTTIDFAENYQGYTSFDLALNGADADGIDFSNIIYTDAVFDELVFDRISGSQDVVRFVLNENLCVETGGRYYLSFSVVPIATGRATYSITLPNGLATSVSFQVVEQLNSISITSTNQNANMDIVEQDSTQALIYARYNSSQTAGNYFDLSVVSNQNENFVENSEAILSYEMSLTSAEQACTISNILGQQFQVNLQNTGSSTITLRVRGYQVNNFIATINTQTFTIQIINYEYINSIGVTKTSDGQNENYPASSTARYVYLYAAPNSVQRRTAQLELDIQEPENTSAYLFRDPETAEFVAEEFDQRFVYWTIPTDNFSIRLDGKEVKQMYVGQGADNVYQIYNNSLVATFDVENLTLSVSADVDSSNGDYFILTANIDQYQTATKAFAIHVRVLEYNAVDTLTILSPISSLEFSSIDQQHTVNLRVLQNTAINKNLRVSITGDRVVYGGQTYRLFGENNSGIVVADGGNIASITLTADSEFISQAVSNPDFFETTFNATLTIAAEDWYDDTGLLLDQYRNSVISISITFANGTDKNRFTIDSLEDLLAVSDNLSAHYKVTTSIDASSITEPLGVLAGSIVGDNDYAAITGINIASVTTENQALYGGLFTEITGYIKNLTFEGNISLPNLAMSSETGEGDEVTQITYENAYIGLIAGKLDGSLTNVSVELNASNINVYESGNVYVGGLVGYNNGKIKQDFREQNPNEESSGYILYAYTLYMNGTLSVEYQNATVYVGGITGYNNGLIKKVDGTENYTGYTNYMAYSLIDVNLAEGAIASKSYVGGIAGYAVSANNEQGILGYSSDSEDAVYDVDTYSAGKGVIVGGEVSGPSYVGGVVGYLNAKSYTEGDIDSFAGITTRTFVRSSSTNIGLLTGSLEVKNGIGLSSVFYIQAIDDRRVGEDASMLVVYSDKSVSLENYNNLAFGIGGANVGTFNSDQSYFISYIRRTLIEIPEGETSITISDSQDAYYGEAVIVNTNDEVTEQEFFETKGETLDLAINGGITEGKNENEKIVNEMKALTTNTKAFYAYYFNAVSAQSEIDNANLSQVQQNLNTYFNTLTSSHKLYPIDVTGEMTLTSLNPNLLDIDQTGQITIKGTGWVQVSGNSILNTNDGISFYIFVTNYFNSNSNVSIIYPNTSQNATALENATISMFANDTAVLYVRPNYEGSISSGDHNLNINADGSAILDGFGFNLATNSDITADIQIGSFSTEDPSKFTPVDEDEFSTSVAGQTIIITKGQSSTAASNFNVIITPKIRGSYNGVTFEAGVNKELKTIDIAYNKGALAIGAGRYDNVTISTSNSFNETIVVRSTADLPKTDDEGQTIPGEGLKYYISFNNEVIQSDYLEGFTDKDVLFNVQITPPTSSGDSEKEPFIKEYNFALSVSVNRNSTAYKNRFENDIYGVYTITILSKTNSAQYININLTLENQALQNIVIDNYINQDQMVSDVGVSTQYAYPGSNGLLAVTLSPDDSDFDYLVIENAQENYNSGNGVATFALAGRKATTKDNENLFEANTILGSATTRGLVLTKNEILNLYNNTSAPANGSKNASSTEGAKKYQTYSGVVYFIYNIGNSGVVENSTSRFVVSVYKDGSLVKQEDIELTLRLQNFVSISIDGKVPEEVTGAYRVARGLRYRLVIDSYGFNNANISAPQIVSGSEYASIVEENGEYYVQITSSDIGSQAPEIEISIEATRQDDDREITASDSISLYVMQFVIDSSLNDTSEDSFGSLDIVSGMSDGVVTVSIGSSRTMEIDIYDYIEYDNTNQAVINMVNQFVRSLTAQGDWNYMTNIAPGQSVPAIGAGEASHSYDFPINSQVETYYFNAILNSTSNMTGLTIVPVRINDATADLYYFTYEIRYAITQGGHGNSYEAVTEGGAKISTEIRFEVFVSSSMDTPIPIFDYEDFLNMNEGGYYILLNDITLPSSNMASNTGSTVSQYTPMTANFASLDGNGHSIILDGVYDFGSSSGLGVFSSLADGSIISNLNVVVRSSYDTGNATYGTIFTTTTAEHRTGLLVGVNNGIITNCKVYSPTNTVFTINCALANIESAYFGSIAGENNGYITNCTSTLNVFGSFNIAGIAGINNGKIAASVYKEGYLQSSDNQIDEGFHVAGLVNVNSASGKIVTSYVTGGITAGSLYSTNTSSYLSGPNFSAGFVYENQGEISDCYSDIYLANSGNMAGFAYVNTGFIKNSFSLSILQNNTIASAGFTMRNIPFDEDQESAGDNDENQGDNSGTGTFENCYYLSHIHSADCPANCQYGRNINVDLNTVSFSGVEAIDNFDVTDSNNDLFDSYAYTNYISTVGVWFFTGEEEIANDYIAFEPTDMQTTVSSDDDSFGTQVNTNYEITSKTLPKGRLELSAPNIDTLSIRNFSYADIDEESGNITYYYEADISTEATRRASTGSIYNPYIIYDAQSMEEEIIDQTNTSTKQNSGNYRVVSDIDYSNYEDNSNIYNTIFVGNFEGNGMEIAYIVLQSNAQMDYAGMFAGLGVSSSRQGAIKNLVLSPSVVNFAGASSVGALVGFVNHGHIYNVDVTTENDLIVQGGNFVGGVVGRAQGSYVFKNITSNVSAIANYTPVEGDRQNLYTESRNTATFSYAGGLFGHVGTGTVENVETTANATIRGNMAGLAFGGIGQGANVSTVRVTASTDSRINAYTYGGFVAGEVSGNLSESVVYNSGSSLSSFSIVGQTPFAVGGIAGVLSGGNISKAVMRQSFSVSEKLSASNTYSTIESVGGVVGIVRSSGSRISYIRETLVEADIQATQNLGGAIGYVVTPIQIDQVAIKPETTQNALQLESHMTTTLYLGGIIGRVGDRVSNNPQIVMTNSYCQSDLTMVAYRTDSTPQTEIGGLIGGYASSSSAGNLTLTNCYTTSRMNARLVDLRNMWDDSSADFNGVIGEGEPEDGTGSYVNFYQQTQNDNIVNTYYYGANERATLNIVQNFISVRANFDVTSSSPIQINNFGQSSYAYAGSATGKTTAGLYNVFMDSYLMNGKDRLSKTIEKDTGEITFGAGEDEISLDTSYLVIYQNIQTDQTQSRLFLKCLTRGDKIEFTYKDLIGTSDDTNVTGLYVEFVVNNPIWVGEFDVGTSNTTFRTLVFESNLYWI